MTSCHTFATDLGLWPHATLWAIGELVSLVPSWSGWASASHTFPHAMLRKSSSQRATEGQRGCGRPCESLHCDAKALCHTVPYPALVRRLRR